MAGGLHWRKCRNGGNTNKQRAREEHWCIRFRALEAASLRRVTSTQSLSRIATNQHSRCQEPASIGHNFGLQKVSVHRHLDFI